MSTAREPEILPADTQVGTVRLQVADLDRSIGYYRDVIGLEAVEARDGAARLTPASGAPVLVELHERPGAAPVPRTGRFGLYHFAILLPDRPALGRFLRHARRLGVALGAADHAVSEALYLHDPDGLGIEVYADRPADRWSYRDGEPMMGTEPLDADDLLEAAGDAAWEGVPAGTVVGHVHLHVGDLAKASSFYESALGFERTVSTYPGALFLSAGGYHHHLGLNTWSRGGPPAEGEARLLDWEVVVPTAADARRAAERLADAGYATTPDDDGGWRAEDPWGTALRVRAGG